MNEFGHFALGVAWLLALGATITGCIAGKTGSARLLASLRNASILTFFATFISIAALAGLFLQHDYSNQYVWQHSSSDMAWVYKITAIWGGMDGSMLLWCLSLSLAVAILAVKSVGQSRLLMPWVLATANSSTLFFLSVTLFLTNPFRYVKAPFIPPEGNGLNPLLQNPYMASHPPMLYLGFTFFAIPFAFCIGALLSGALSNEWLRLTRRWTLVAWAFLTAGIVMGGHWAYIELGWGGFWAWDPVENASFLPWLTGTAFLHSVMVQERKNMLKLWNVWLIVLTYALTVFGTFLTRSGVVQSVHAFASTDVGWIFLVYLGLILGGTIALSIYRRSELASERKIESFVSREAAFLVNNLIFLSICFATLWGVLFPVLSEAVTGVKQTVSIPFFNAVNVPLFLLMLFMMGVGPLIAWRRANWASLKRAFIGPFLFALGLACLLTWAGITSFYAILSYALCFFVFLTIMAEFHRGMKVQRAALRADSNGANNELYASGLSKLFRRHRTRYGGYIVHLGVVVLVVAITASMAHKTEKEFSLAQGEEFAIGRFILRLEGLSEIQKPSYSGLMANISVLARKDRESIGKMAPELRRYVRNDESTTEVALRISPREDLYIILAGLDDSGSKAALKVFINPLQIWLWIGALIMIVGTGIVLVPAGQPARVRAGVTESVAKRIYIGGQ